MKYKKIIKTTSSSFIYRRAIRAIASCPYCPPNRGCNRRNRSSNKRTWKKYRKHQYKYKGIDTNDTEFDGKIIVGNI